MEIKFLPYQEINGAWTLQDDDVLRMFERMEAQGLRDVVFYQFGCDGRRFLEIMKSAPLVNIVFDGPTVAGLVWLNRPESRTARVHFCFFHGYQGKFAVTAAKKWLQQVMEKKSPIDGQYWFDALIGLTPVKNHPAIRFLKNIGATTAAVIPNGVWNHKTQQSEPAMMSYFTRENLQ